MRYVYFDFEYTIFTRSVSTSRRERKHKRRNVIKTRNRYLNIDTFFISSIKKCEVIMKRC